MEVENEFDEIGYFMLVYLKFIINCLRLKVVGNMGFVGVVILFYGVMIFDGDFNLDSVVC